MSDNENKTTDDIAKALAQAIAESLNPYVGKTVATAFSAEQTKAVLHREFETLLHGNASSDHLEVVDVTSDEDRAARRLSFDLLPKTELGRYMIEHLKKAGIGI